MGVAGLSKGNPFPMACIGTMLASPGRYVLAGGWGAKCADPFPRRDNLPAWQVDLSLRRGVRLGPRRPSQQSSFVR